MSNQSHQEDLLDEALDESYPASDPVSVTVLPAKANPFAKDEPAPAPPSSRLPLVLGSLAGLAAAAVGAGAWLSARRHEQARVRRQQLLTTVPLVVAGIVTGALAIRRSLRRDPVDE